MNSTTSPSERARVRRTRPCVRCGSEPRHISLETGDELFLGAECLVSGEYRAEAARALEEDPEHPRLWLIGNGWRGGWGRTA